MIKLITVLGRIPVGFWVMIIQVFLWINAAWIYGPFADSVREILQIYFILFLITYVSLGLKLPTFNGRTESMANFLLMFVITAVFMTTVFPLVVLKQAASIEPEAIAIAYGFVFFHGFVKAYVEEIVFRYAIPFALNLKGSLEIYGALISSVLFGIFHMSVAFLSNNPYPVWMMFYLSLLGMVFYFIYKKSGIMGSTGAHFAYNLGVLGVLPALIGGVA